MSGTLVLMVVLSGTARGYSTSVVPTENGVRASTVSVNSCTSGQTAIVETAVADATTYLAVATTYFDDVRSGSRYTSWFGAYDSTRWNVVKSTFQAVENMVTSGYIDFDCSGTGCGGGSTYGYSFPNDTSPYTVYLCGAFWAAPPTGTDSRAGTLIHEWTHFNGTGQTLDYAYGKSGAGTLALGNPNWAVDNADNYEYFAENDPVIVDNTPVRSVSATSHNFGSVPAGTSSSAYVFMLTNGGDGNLIVANLVPTSTFTLASDTCSGSTVVPSASCSFGVVFSPTVAGPTSGSVTVYNNSGAGALVVALAGSGTLTAPVGGLVTLDPERIVNTRPIGKIGNRTGTADPMVFNVYGKGGLPMSGIGAVLLNVTVVDPEVGDEGGFLTVYPCASGRPDASNLNFVARQIIANTVIAPVDPSGNICFYSYGTTHVLADVSGYFPR